MATDLIKAADDARRILKGFKAFAEVADALEAAGQVEQRAAEAAKVLAGLQPQIAAAKAEIAKVEEERAAVLADATIKSANLVQTAHDKADKLVADAQEQVLKAQSTASDALDKAAAATATAVAKATDALAQRDALLAECEALEARLAKARTQVAKLLG